MSSLIYQMKANQFPFGELSHSQADTKKMLVRKRIYYKNQVEYLKLKQQIDKLKQISHKNTINLRSTQDNGKGFIDLFYPYVPIPLEDSFSINSFQTVKQLHKQFIELAIYLAKQYILTSFNPARCGAIVSERTTLIKYYLPLNEIVVTDNISMLQRSSMHYLDTLSQSAISHTHQSSSRSSFHNKSNIYVGENRKMRKESQPPGLQFNRKLSINPLSRQMRKLSHLSKQLSQFSQMHKRRAKQSTKISTASFASHPLRQDSSRDLLKSYVFQTKMIEERVVNVKERSRWAIKEFKELLKVMDQHRSVSVLIGRINN